VCNTDSNPLVAGKGIKKLRDAGIEVTTGVLEAEGRELNKRFFTFIEKQRPYIILKWAETADGFIAQVDMNSKWISNEFSRKLVHKWRTEEDAILVGSRTALHDNPMLNVRDWTGRDPVRILIDRFLKTHEVNLKLFDGTQKTLCYNVVKDEERLNLSFVKIAGGNFIDNMLRDLYQREIQSVIIEGGAGILQAFIDAGFWDEARVFVSPKTFGDGIKSPVLEGEPIYEHVVSSDVLKIWKPKS
jgi:diaminohydroxyphosphoribosylaminopyrimidine deaminase/5-amino-6-(5-phosphoribosylamino)uracil reductase